MKKDPQIPSDLSARADEIFFASLDIESESERHRFIEESCKENDALYKEVERLFSLQATSETAFNLSSASRLTAMDIANTITNIPEFYENMKTALPDDDEIGKQIGTYKLLQKIGEGGVGNVYLAEQKKPIRRLVALKIIKAGMDTKNVIARFEAERQALAMMEHPNIAHVLNAGETETGRPYFVMELVHGERITTYCDANRLNISDRLSLFIQVCHAIQHAHNKGIIHRDIKPSNVLITMHDGIPSPVVIDFGIAKATTGDLLTEKTVNTSVGPLIGTPAYMSPEQTKLAQMDIDTRSDIYSLGVLLYELLTGQTPFDQKMLLRTSIDELCRVIREEEPLRPSLRFDRMDEEDQVETAKNRSMDPRKLESILKNDLDWIVMMALQKDREHRYETANALALDIEHFTRSEPVLASPPGRMYRFRKLVHRNKRVFFTTAAIALALIVGFGMSSWFLVKERAARKRAVIAEQQQSQLRLEAEDRERIAHAAFLLSQNKIEEADRVAAAITTELGPSLEAESVLRTLGEWHALKGEWAQAATLFSALLKVDEMDNSYAITGDLLMAGPILIEHGNIVDYELFRKVAIARYRGTDDPVFAERTLKISLLMPADGQEMHELQALYDLAADATQGRIGSIMGSWRCVSLALGAYRQGFYPTAVTWGEKARSFDQIQARDATARIIQAMAHYQLDEMDAAKSELDLGRKAITAVFAEDFNVATNWKKGFWYDWLFARILLREAETLILGPPLENE